MGVINIMLKTFSAVLSISVTVPIIQVFCMTEIAHPCCFDLAYSAPSLIMLGSKYTNMYSSFLCL